MKKEDLLRAKKMLDDCAGDPCKERQFDQKLMHAVAKAEGLGAEGAADLVAELVIKQVKEMRLDE